MWKIEGIFTVIIMASMQGEIECYYSRRRGTIVGVKVSIDQLWLAPDFSTECAGTWLGAATTVEVYVSL
uniref:Uncharacterized protein n=1 Tax=Ciona intestinalis TaxID=7719 RepID=H2Y3I6_CIOIN